MKSDSTDLSEGNILIVDDLPTNLHLLSITLKKQGYKVRSAINGKLAFMGVKAELPDLILLDINLPDINGYDVCRQLKEDSQTANIPVIFISALDEVFDKVKAFEVGGVDYISKPFHIPEVLARVKNQLNLLRLNQKIQEQNRQLQQEINEKIAAENQIRELNKMLEQRILERTAQLQTVNRKLEEEIVERKQVQKQLLHMALHDHLTGLPNRASFIKQLEQALQCVKNNPNYRFAVLFLDCDRFKVVNDSLGHFIGDQLLIVIAKRLSSCLPVSSMLARLGGDEFTIFLENISAISDAIKVTKQCQNALKSPFYLEQHEIFINASCGIVLGNEEYKQPEHLLRDADTAMYHAKANGKANYQVFQPEMHHLALDLLKLETDLRLALHRQEFLVYYQPIISLITNKINGFEALIRWNHPKHGFISPEKFIPVAEETGLIIPLGNWILEEACNQMSIWQQQHQLISPLTISVNMSVKQFSQPNLIEQIDQILQKTKLHSQILKLEITESAIMENTESVTEILQQLRNRQIQLSIDDFGTGYSSLSYLHRFHVDNLKIDRSFVSRIDNTNQNLEIIKIIITLAHYLDMTVTAEGIETCHQKEHLQTLGCEFGQGYFFAKPLDSQSAENLISVDNQVFS